MTPALFRLTIFNICGAAGLIAAWRLGYIGYVMRADAVGMAYVIAALFVAGLVSVYVRMREAARIRRQNAWSGGQRSRSIRILNIRSAHIPIIYSALFILGIIGNGLGIIMAFKAGSTDTATIASAVLAGLGTSFGSTVIGSTLALWMMANSQILTTEIDLLAEGA